MAKYRKKPVVIEAVQWFAHGEREGLEHSKVRYFRRPDVNGEKKCGLCLARMDVHGWIDTLEAGHRVCPGDWIIEGISGEFYPCKPDIFAEIYECVN